MGVEGEGEGEGRTPAGRWAGRAPLCVGVGVVEGGLTRAGALGGGVSVPGTTSGTVWVFSCSDKRDQ